MMKLFHSTRRNFDYRYESMQKVSVKIRQPEEHDVFAVLGD